MIFDRADHMQTLRRRLREIQLRLGTPAETNTDLDLAARIAHELRNVEQVRILAEELTAWTTVNPSPTSQES